MARNDRPINLEEDCWIGKNSKIEKKFNISTNHLHYNKTAVNALMSSNHFKLTILRNPESQFVSSFIFENLIDLFSIITIYSRNWRLSWIHAPNIIKWDVEHLIYDTRRVSFHFSSLAPPAIIFVISQVHSRDKRTRLRTWVGTQQRLGHKIFWDFEHGLGHDFGGPGFLKFSWSWSVPVLDFSI